MLLESLVMPVLCLSVYTEGGISLGSRGATFLKTTVYGSHEEEEEEEVSRDIREGIMAFT